MTEPTYRYRKVAQITAKDLQLADVIWIDAGPSKRDVGSWAPIVEAHRDADELGVIRQGVIAARSAVNARALNGTVGNTSLAQFLTPEVMERVRDGLSVVIQVRRNADWLDAANWREFPLYDLVRTQVMSNQP